jgi:hypothetical protein
MVLPTTRAPTQVTCSFLKIVSSLTAFRRSAQHKIAAAFPFGYRRTGRPHFKNLHPSAGAGRPLYTLTQISVNVFPSNFSGSGPI